MYIYSNEPVKPFHIPTTVQGMDDQGIGGQLIGSIKSSTSTRSRLETDSLTKLVLEEMAVALRTSKSTSTPRGTVIKH